MRRSTIAALCALTISNLGCSSDPEPNVDAGVDMTAADMNAADMNVADTSAPSMDSGPVDTGPDMALVNPEFCDPVSQNCVEPDASVCGIVFPPNNMPLNFVCRESLGEVGVGEPCTRPTGVAGEDDCAPGHFCSSYGLPTAEPQQRVCRALCDAHADCGDDAHCIWLHPIGNVGTCTDACDPRGDDCVEGSKCSMFFSGPDLQSYWICTNDAGANIGDPCSGSEQCGAGQWCPFSTTPADRKCTAFCADDIPCPNGEACLPNAQMPGYGACEQ